jgi:16S rRNA (guanine966-N2)-methyltransferase
MSIRILGGLAKSRSLLVPKGQLIRPTSVLLKRRVFDSFQDLSPYSFWDLCAGTGSIGLEAWSRGAEKVLLSEASKDVFKLMKKNVDEVRQGLEEEFKQRPITCSQLKVEKWFSSLGPSLGYGNDIFFLDPPYEMHNIYKTVGLGLLEKLDGDQQLWIESDKDKGLKLEFWSEQGHEPYKVFKQGGSYLALFAKR